MRLVRMLAVATVAALALAGCGGGADKPSTTPPTGEKLTGTVTVLAAASLTESFTAIGKDFEAAHPGVKVTFSFGASSTLATQIVNGAPADVFASASPTNMKQVTDANLATAPTVFARNQLVIAVPKGNKAGIKTIEDLAKPNVKVALCATQVPCGAAATKALAAANVKVTPVTLEADVKAALTKVRLGEVDAALVYRTDAQAASADVEAIEFTASAQAVNEYPIVAIAKAPNSAGAAAFVAYVLSDKAKAILTKAGFQNP
ncbi:molybdate-binding protein [Longispora fulva]|uniref:Molybdate transport system substrate-binding protein n=1 Tax=Longispora fulva TaxID=619741 RepID=A0A8J7KWN4_9ACTN|nr:molybdate ABC transporter substrate-binding protein [Longispora fulva]MBG6136772.1 molybdate transport system substrate-binding protein [Longispora fulva]GIG59943.1 molybdate-binding protein [Longispora fulva]